MTKISRFICIMYVFLRLKLVGTQITGEARLDSPFSFCAIKSKSFISCYAGDPSFDYACANFVRVKFKKERAEFVGEHDLDFPAAHQITELMLLASRL